MTTTILITQAEYAKHRGCTPAAVSKAVREGRITLVDGKVNPIAADAEWAEKTRARVGSGREWSATDAGEVDRPASAVQHLNPARTRGRSDVAVSAVSQPQPVHAVAVGNHRTRLACAVLAAADHALSCGQDIEHIVPALRASLCAIPQGERHAHALPFRVMNHLVADVLASANAMGSGPHMHALWTKDGREPVAFHFWFEVASGEARRTEGDDDDADE